MHASYRNDTDEPAHFVPGCTSRAEAWLDPSPTRNHERTVARLLDERTAVPGAQWPQVTEFSKKRTPVRYCVTPLHDDGGMDLAAVVEQVQHVAAVRAADAAEREPVSYTHLRAHETDSYLVCRLLLE